MYYGINQNGIRTYIDDSVNKEKYFCPLCNGILIRKARGTKVAHHYAHKCNPCDSWTHADGKSAWHKEMQDHFPRELQEKCLMYNGEKHVADIFIKREKAANIVFEFQHSFISQEEFDRRNLFYTFADANINERDEKIKNLIIWVFDMRDKKIYIDLSDDSKSFPSAETGTDPVCTKILNEYRKKYGFSRVCNYKPNIPKFLKRTSQISYREDVHINRSIDPAEGLFARIHWKRPNNIFGHVGDNTLVFFDVVQRKYASMNNEHTNDYGRTFSHKKYDYLGDELKEGIDEMSRFFVEMSAKFYGKHAYYLHNGESDFMGICYPADYFWHADADSAPLWIPGK